MPPKQVLDVITRERSVQGRRRDTAVDLDTWSQNVLFGSAAGNLLHHVRQIGIRLAHVSGQVFVIRWLDLQRHRPFVFVLVQRFDYPGKLNLPCPDCDRLGTDVIFQMDIPDSGRIVPNERFGVDLCRMKRSTMARRSADMALELDALNTLT